MTKPDWIRGRVSWSEDLGKVRDLLQGLSLNSVCVSAACPNRGDCWKERHVTFLIMGNTCTRCCRFCNIREGHPKELDPKEPENISKAVKELGAKYVVITSVTRDDISDKGAGHFLKTVNAVKKRTPEAMVEILIPDFDANETFLSEMAFSGADAIGHNIEMPENLYPEIRPRADYARSLKTLAILRKKAGNIPIKSSIMLGLGETEEDILRTLDDLKGEGVDIVYLGQYLNPSRDHWPVKRYYNPSEFHFFRKKAREMGFKAAMSGPMVRSSYRAYDSYRTCLDNWHI